MFLGLVVVLVGLLLIAGWKVHTTRRISAELEGCRANLLAIAGALERYADAHSGRFPLSRTSPYDPWYQGSPAVAALGLAKLVPQYLPAIPTCPAAHKDTYSLDFLSCPALDNYFVACRGLHHREAGVEHDRPSVTQWGLDSPLTTLEYSASVDEKDVPPLAQMPALGPLHLRMSLGEARPYVQPHIYRPVFTTPATWDGPLVPPWEWKDGVVYFDRANRCVSVSGTHLSVKGKTLDADTPADEVHAVLGNAARVRTIGKYMGHSVRWEYPGDRFHLDVDFDPATMRVRYFVLWCDPE